MDERTKSKVLNYVKKALSEQMTFPENEQTNPGLTLGMIALYEQLMTPEQRMERIEREKVYELQRLNDNLENQRSLTAYPSWYSTWKSTPVKKWKPDLTLLYLAGFEILVVGAFVAFIIAYFIGGNQC